jgi:hypothetical protein
MATTLVATAGGSTSNSYVTVAEANAYFEEHPEFAAWDKLATASGKERYLMTATRIIDRQPIDGGKYDTTTTSGVPDQALKFPRAADYDGGVFIPVEVKEATYEQALYLAKVGGPSNTRAVLQAQGVTAASVDSVSETYGKGATAAGLCPEATRILTAAGFLALGAEMTP